MVPNEQGLYAGEFRHNLDAKKRLTIPSKWRFNGDESGQFLAFPDPSGCITVYPPEMVAQLKEKLSAVGMSNRVGQRAITRLFGASDAFTIDKSGRVNLTDRLCSHSGIEKACVLVGTLSKFSIWNPDRYEEYITPSEDEGDIADILGDLGL
ncbi:hypothetical protein [Rubellicoccus peritrichatus]|uniref:Transcriptional regulator MraZ n=1 Tax=Rubellicoccus peritrichatus TaxID=3080537 RepID=A0AAQ3LDU0_9BACT|nr:hypothetical protein [Puniceicoccus sp. CR14]WOO43542.1 hypothetical protein RZN69_10625 [Puniceicoccus sp. CR14]